MEISQRPPQGVLSQINHSDSMDFIISAASDLLPDGRFGKSWLLGTTEKLWIFTSSEPDALQRPTAVKALVKLLPKSYSDTATNVSQDLDNYQLYKEFNLKNCTEIKIEPLVGASRFIIHLDGKPTEIIRFSSALTDTFSYVKSQISAIIEERDQPAAPTKLTRCPKCDRPLPKDSQICRNCAPSGQSLKRVLSFAKPYKWWVAVSTFMLICGTAVELAPPIVSKIMIDKVLIPRSNSSLLFYLILGLIGIRIIGVVMSIFRGRLQTYLGNIIAYDIRAELFRHLQWLSMAFYDKRSSGSLLSRVLYDTSGVYDFLADGLPNMLNWVTQVLGISIILLYFNWKLALLVLIPAPLVAIIVRLIRKRLRRYWAQVWNRWSRMAGSISSTFTAIRVVKAFAKERYEVRRFKNKLNDLYDSSMRAEQTWATVFPMIGFIVGFGTFLVWYFGGLKVINNSMTMGELFMFISYLGMFIGPLQAMTRIIDWLSRSGSAADRIFEVLDTEPDVKEDSDAVALEEVKGEVEFHDVGFSYEVGIEVLHDINIKVKPGEMIGLVGHSGAGKSTLINLLCRFYDPTSGDISVDGIPMTHIKLEDLRRHIGVVLQESILFPTSIRDNIAYAKRDASPEEIIAAAKAANAHHFIMKFPDAYDTRVGDRGQRLSGGERQRIAIARAILHNPSILILDEATASVDTETEHQIQEALGHLIKGRTTFAIAHRLSTLRNADRLIVLEKGKIAEEGTHDELMEAQGVFYKLVTMQMEINKLRTI